MDARDISILTQVAFKAAIESAPPGTDDASRASFVEHLSFLADALTAEVRARLGSPAPAATPAVTAESAIAAIKETFPGAVETEGAPATVEVITTKNGGQHGPLPSWLIPAAAAKGVTKVFDNRDRLVTNPKMPWFKSPKDQGEIPFWPPREKALS